MWCVTGMKSWSMVGVLLLFFDLSKAFDSLPHRLILESLVRVGVCGELLFWVADYLSGRRQRVVLQGVSSPSVEVPSAVSQGSILGPLFFILAVDMLASLSISSLGRIVMFADDICYYRSLLSNTDQLAVQMNVDLIHEWVRDRKLRLNVAKTKSMVISRKRKPLTLNLSIEGSPTIAQVDTFRYLGVQISSDLSWVTHIISVCSRARKFIGFLYRYFYQDTRCLSRLYRALVLPILDYGCCIRDPYHLKYQVLLEKVEHFAAKLATKRWSSNPSVLTSELGWAPLQSRRRYLKLCLCRRILGDTSLIPSTVFKLHPSVNIRHLNSIPLL